MEEGIESKTCKVLDFHGYSSVFSSSNGQSFHRSEINASGMESERNGKAKESVVSVVV